ncbi:tRNA (adenosine(37)-N6)-threonylcarbamoyltransferase complex transferase subunit TsaD [Candidatus Saccharibacteria bacterium]|nr:tRNA (adenosine(37)-N6)-threonylcarbamoyltransferase complex transferase subunit TsaD [Candidatus Saccharibacteria bacterium]
MRVLGIESSCDETAVGICEISDSKLNVLSNVLVSQIDIHKAYGGVVPEVAARSHIEAIIPTLESSLEQAFPDQDAETAWNFIDAIAVTYGAGLSGSLLIGALTARSIAIAKQKPLYACNHIEAHVFANFITGDHRSVPDEQKYKLPLRAPEFPLLALIVSGRHTQLVLFENYSEYQILGRSHDDAIGEAFDKVAKMTGLPYPGGPSVAARAELGNPFAFELPKANMSGRYDFSYSGVKTAVLRKAQELCGKDFSLPSKDLPALLSPEAIDDICAVFQRVAVETVVEKTVLAFEEFSPKSVVIAGGVAASSELRRQLQENLPIAPSYTDPRLCTDNGAMIAALGCIRINQGASQADPYSLEIDPSLTM